MDRNLILAIALSMGVIFAWDMLVAGPERDRAKEAREAAAVQTETTANPEVVGMSAPEPVMQDISVDDAIALAPGRVLIKTDDLEGSINLRGGRIDDLLLVQYDQTLDANSGHIRLLSPRETEHGHYMQVGWSINNQLESNQIWTAPDGAVLTAQTPVTLTREKDGLVFEKTYSIDEKYMFAIEQTVRNESGEVQSLIPYGLVVQRNIPAEKNRGGFILHEGPLGVIGQELHERKYNKLRKNPNKRVDENGVGGWVGITNKYWLAAAIPPTNEEMKATLANVGTESEPIFRANYSLPKRELAAGESLSVTTHLFGGAKDVDILQTYEKNIDGFLPGAGEGTEGSVGVYDFDKAVDWGNFFFLTRPIFYTLNYFGDLTGNFGIAILILTLIIKAILFPLANKGYESMSKMKKLQPEIEKLRARHEDDKMKLQQEMMALYKKEKMNPMAGCLPILLQMPIFYALYKTLFVTIELRHKPFLYIQDLSAQDPTTVFNLFGLLPYDPTALPLIGALLGIGILPLLMGVAMWFQTKLNPPPTDPVQAQIFAMMPFVFVFIFAPFAAGLVLYWFWNTALSILQQWLIMKKNGVSVDWGDRIRLPGMKKKASGETK